MEAERTGAKAVKRGKVKERMQAKVARVTHRREFVSDSEIRENVHALTVPMTTRLKPLAALLKER